MNIVLPDVSLCVEFWFIDHQALGNHCLGLMTIKYWRTIKSQQCSPEPICPTRQRRLSHGANTLFRVLEELGNTFMPRTRHKDNQPANSCQHRSLAMAMLPAQLMPRAPPHQESRQLHDVCSHLYPLNTSHLHPTLVCRTHSI